MFSGIVDAVGCILSVVLRDGCKHFTISSNSIYQDLVIGESIAVNGTCLTVTHFSPEFFAVTAVPETLRLTNLDELTVGNKVNLERAMTLSSRVGGHYVQGHIDGIGKIVALRYDNSSAMWLDITVPPHLSKYMVNKGYITLDGMSITIINAAPSLISVTLIPHTQAVTIAKDYQVGKIINLEVDLMGKYIEKLLEVRSHANTN